MQLMVLKKIFLQNNGKFKKRLNVRLINNTKDHKKYVTKPSFVSQQIFSENSVAIHEIKPVSKRNKPIYGGFNILDLRIVFGKKSLFFRKVCFSI